MPPSPATITPAAATTPMPAGNTPYIQTPWNPASPGIPFSQVVPAAPSNSIQALNLLQSVYGSAQFDNYEVIRYSYWDYNAYNPAGTTSMSFFTIPQGGTDPVSGLGKSAEQTNMVKQGSFGQVYVIWTQIRMDVMLLPLSRQSSAVQALTSCLYAQYATAQAQLLNLINQGVLVINIGQKQFFDIQRPFRRTPPGFGIDVQSMGSTTTTVTTGPWVSAYVTPSPRDRDTYTLAPVQLIEPEQQFQCTLTFPNGLSPAFTSGNGIGGNTAALSVGLIFDGYVARPIQ
jgi:hypothetical protein